jgi:hypothetical protein
VEVVQRIQNSQAENGNKKLQSDLFTFNIFIYIHITKAILLERYKNINSDNIRTKSEWWSGARSNEAEEDEFNDVLDRFQMEERREKEALKHLRSLNKGRQMPPMQELDSHASSDFENKSE